MTTSHPVAPRFEFVDIGTARLRVAVWGDVEHRTRDALAAPTIVMLHDGLGSIGQWRDVPALLHDRTGASVVAYERAGHGVSTPPPEGPWPADWLHREATVLGELLERLEIIDPLVVGHSDGGSIALIHAATGGSCRAVVALAAHTWVEPVCTDAIEAMRGDAGRIAIGLARYHDAPAALFEAWSGVWVSSEFAAWDIRPDLADIECPVVVAQGTEDGYATRAQLTDTVAAIGPIAVEHEFEGAGHILHHDVPAAVVDLIATFHDEHLGEVRAGA